MREMRMMGEGEAKSTGDWVGGYLDGRVQRQVIWRVSDLVCGVIDERVEAGADGWIDGWR